MDRVVAAFAAMPAALYFMAAAVAWFRVFSPSSMPAVSNRVMLDRAVAWSALCIILSTVVTVKLKLVSWDDFRIELILAAALFAFFVAGLASVRAITVAAFGGRVLAVFTVVSITVGLLVLFL